MPRLVTIERHIIDAQKRFPKATGDFSQLLYDIALTGKIIAREVNKAGLVDVLGFTGDTNIHGEQVRKLDEYADSIIYQTMNHTGRLCMMASEEQEGIIPIPEKHPCGHYVLLYDPLDGSSNIDANVSIGTIFAIYRKISKGERGSLEDCLQKGDEQIAAGYILYGASTMMVFSAGLGVQGFTYDPSVGEFLLSHPDIQTPKRGKLYSTNEGHSSGWHPRIREYIEYLKTDRNANGKAYSARYVGSMVADFHRNLLYGGIYLYAGDKENPNGKLRLMYEANPMAFLVEKAGGAASTGHKRILDIQPESIHQTTPLIMGSIEDVREAERFIRDKK